MSYSYQKNPMIHDSDKIESIISPQSVIVEPMEIYSGENGFSYAQVDGLNGNDRNDLHSNAYREAEEIRRKLAISQKDGNKILLENDFGIIQSHVEGVKLSNQQQKVINNYTEKFSDADMTVYSEVSAYPTAPYTPMSAPSISSNYSHSGPPVMSNYKSIYDNDNNSSSGYQMSEYKSIYD